MDAVAYAEVLVGRTEGYPFHSPQAEGVIGDCGLIKDGQFVVLFNCFTDGIGGERLQTSEPNPARIPIASDLTTHPAVADRKERSVDVQPNQGVFWRVHKGRRWSVELEVPIPLPAVEIGFGFQASNSSGKAAFLAPGSASRRVEKFHKDKVFPSYLSRHSGDIRARFGSEYSTRTVYILEGTTHAPSWCRGVATRHENEIRGFVAVNPMLPGIPGWRVGGSTGQSIEHPWGIQSGPQIQPPNGELYLISARLAVRRSRLREVLRATSGVTALAHDPSSHNSDGQTPGAQSSLLHPSHAQSDTMWGVSAGIGDSSSRTALEAINTVSPQNLDGQELGTASEPHSSRGHGRTSAESSAVSGSSSSGASPQRITSIGSNSGGVVLEAASSVPSDGPELSTRHRQTESETDTRAPSSSPDTSDVDDTLNPPNAIEALLDAALAQHPRFKAIVVGWTVLETFWTNLYRSTDYDVQHLVFEVEETEGCEDGRVAQLCAISPRGSNLDAKISTAIKRDDTRTTTTLRPPRSDWVTPLVSYYHATNPSAVSWSEATQSGSKWTISVLINDTLYGTGSGTSIRMAKHEAAKRAIEELQKMGINIVPM